MTQRIPFPARIANISPELVAALARLTYRAIAAKTNRQADDVHHQCVALVTDAIARNNVAELNALAKVIPCPVSRNLVKVHLGDQYLHTLPTQATT